MPFLGWNSGNIPRHLALAEDCVLGRDQEQCVASAPEDSSVSRRHAQVSQERGQWWIRDLGSRNGTTVDGELVDQESGRVLFDGNILKLGDWKLRFSIGFPGLDPALYAEHIGDIFSELRTDPSQALKLVQGLELLQRSNEALLRETEAMAMVQSLLDQALRLLGAQRGFVAMVGGDRSIQSVHRVGDVEEALGLSRSVLDYVLIHRTGVLSNAPLTDPRFGGLSLMELRRGPLLCAPLDTGDEVLGVLYLDRDPGNPTAGLPEPVPFSRFDLALFQSFVRQSTVTLRHDQLARKALGVAEVEAELVRFRAAHLHISGRREELLQALESPLRWACRLAEGLEGGEPLRLELGHLKALMETARLEQAESAGAESAKGKVESLADLQTRLVSRWNPLLGSLGAVIRADPAPEGMAWMARSEGLLALQSLVEPLLAQTAAGVEVRLAWERQPGSWIAGITIPGITQPPSPDAWTQRMLRDSGLTYRWRDQTLQLALHEGSVPAPDSSDRPLLGMVACGEDLAGFFEEVAEAQDLTLHRLEIDPPLPPVPAHRLVVIDAMNLPDPVETVRAYRRHPAFSVCPIMVLRIHEDRVPELLGAGATDWLPTGFRWEALHHRLQVLRSHEELQKKALNAERLDSFRMMAGTLKHEINNPLAVMSMQIELLERKYPAEPKLAKIAEMIERIQGLIQVLQKMREATPEAYADGSKILKLG